MDPGAEKRYIVNFLPYVVIILPSNFTGFHRRMNFPSQILFLVLVFGNVVYEACAYYYIIFLY